MNKKVYLETLGCSKNRVDSEIMLGSLNNQGYQFTDDAEEAEVIIVNTCGFLSAASQESITRILELSDLKQEGRCEKLVAAGCVTQRYGSELAQKIPEIDGLLGSSGFEQIPELLYQLYHPEGQFKQFFQKKPHYRQYQRQERIQCRARQQCGRSSSALSYPLLHDLFPQAPCNHFLRCRLKRQI